MFWLLTDEVALCKLLVWSPCTGPANVRSQVDATVSHAVLGCGHWTAGPHGWVERNRSGVVAVAASSCDRDPLAGVSEANSRRRRRLDVRTDSCVARAHEHRAPPRTDHAIRHVA